MSDSLIIIPTYNEKENIERILRKVFSLEKAFHVLIVDDGSPDGTADIVKGLQKKFKEAYTLRSERENWDLELLISMALNGPLKETISLFLKWMQTFHMIQMT